jgi:hypothetical protein
MMKSSSMRSLALAAVVAAFVGIGCGGGGAGGGDAEQGWTPVGEKGAAPSEPLAKADAVNVTYYYLPG